jgi:hypothetical protein
MLTSGSKEPTLLQSIYDRPMSDDVPSYLFRDGRFARNGDSVVSAAPLDVVTSVYGGGGLHGEEGLALVFGGCAFFRDDKDGPAFVGVWGARKASQFRETLRRAGIRTKIARRPPPARLMFYQTKSGRRPRPSDPYRARYSRERLARLFRDRRAPPG